MRALILITLASMTVASFQALAAGSSDQPLNCDVGPLERTIAGSTWLVYSCGDESTLVFITPAGSKSFPFVFSLHRTETGYRLSGQGAGPKAATDPVAKMLSAMSVQNIAALIEQTKSVKKK
jgi:hypothetical protein